MTASTKGSIKLPTIGSFSEDPKTQARQTAELERRGQAALKQADAKIAELEAAIAALEARVTALEP